MFKKLFFGILGKSRQRIEAEHAYEKEFGRQPPRSFSTSFIRNRIAEHQRPMAVRVNSGHGVRSAINRINEEGK